MDNKLGVQRVKENSLIITDKITPGKFTLEKLLGKGKIASLTDKFDSRNTKKDVKLPLLKKIGQ